MQPENIFIILLSASIGFGPIGYLEYIILRNAHSTAQKISLTVGSISAGYGVMTATAEILMLLILDRPISMGKFLPAILFNLMLLPAIMAIIYYANRIKHAPAKSESHKVERPYSSDTRNFKFPAQVAGYAAVMLISIGGASYYYSPPTPSRTSENQITITFKPNSGSNIYEVSMPNKMTYKLEGTAEGSIRQMIDAILKKDPEALTPKS